MVYLLCQINGVIKNNQFLEQNLQIKTEMNNTRKYSNRQDSSMKQPSQTEHMQLSSSRQQITEEKRQSLRNWSDREEELFRMFWMEKLKGDPLKVYSFDNPLKRSHHFQELSTFLRNYGVDKDDKQCKSKFATIRRKIQREKARGKRGAEYGFIDYIMSRTKGESSPQVYALLLELMSMKQKQSKFMEATKKILAFEEKDSLEKNNSICAYLNELGMLPNFNI